MRVYVIFALTNCHDIFSSFLLLGAGFFINVFGLEFILRLFSSFFPNGVGQAMPANLYTFYEIYFLYRPLQDS